MFDKLICSYLAEEMGLLNGLYNIGAMLWHNGVVGWKDFTAFLETLVV